MRLAIHPAVRGKPSRESRVNLGRGWVNLDLTWPDAFALITQDGYATSAELRGDHRAESEFVSRQLLMVDIDSGMTIPELLANPFYDEYGAGFYVTPSHSWAAHRFRICFVLEQAERDAQRLRRVNRGLLRVFGEADEACKDPTRLFYGTPQCEAAEIRDRVLDPVAVAALTELIEAEDAERAQVTATYDRERDLTDWERRRIVDLLRGSYVGEYVVWRNIGWGLKSGGFSLADFQYITSGMMSSKSAADARTLWEAGSDQGGITMGTVRHFLKTRYGQDCLRPTEEQAVEAAEQEIAKTIAKIEARKARWQQKQNQ